LPDTITGQTRPDGTLAFSYHTAKTNADEILDILRAADIQIAAISTEQSDLEDVFLALTSSR
jgi:ABC-2 type transport system ATP-binding protein